MLALQHSFTLPAGSMRLTGDLSLPPQATGLVVVAHSGAHSHRSSRSRHICRLLLQADLGTFSLDLLAPREAQQQHGHLDVSLLAQRLVATIQWAQQQPQLLGLRLGVLGEEAAAQAALVAGTQLGPRVGAIVALGGVPVAEEAIQPAARPTLLLVGEQDAAGRQVEAQLRQALGPAGQVRAIAQAGAFFQDLSTLSQAVKQAAAWFTTYLPKPFR